jgi:hypothetical protein
MECENQWAYSLSDKLFAFISFWTKSWLDCGNKGTHERGDVNSFEKSELM